MMALVTGGASSGKSAFAEQLAVALGGDLVYLATMRPFGEEGSRRVERHRAQRAGKGFATVECYGGLEGTLSTGCFDGATVLLEDLGNLVANGLFGGDGPIGGASSACDGLAQLAHRAANLIVVSNEVGCDGYTYGHETLFYQKELGRVACEAAAMSDVVVECVVGVPTAIKVPASCGSLAGFAWNRTVAECGDRP